MFFFCFMCSNFFPSLYSPLKQFNITLSGSRGVFGAFTGIQCLCDIESFMYSMKCHSLVCELFVMNCDILEDKRTFVITVSVQDPLCVVAIPLIWRSRK